MVRRCSAIVAIVLLVLAPSPGGASDTSLSDVDGHPRSRFPLAIHLAPGEDTVLDAALSRAVSGWNVVAREALGVEVFAPVLQQGAAQVVVRFVPSTRRGLMGETDVRASGGVISLPVRIEIVQPEARGQTKIGRAHV